MTHKVIKLEIVVFDQYEAEALNDVLGDIFEREDWLVYSWNTTRATPSQAAWYAAQPNRMVGADD